MEKNLDSLGDKNYPHSIIQKFPEMIKISTDVPLNINLFLSVSLDCLCKSSDHVIPCFHVIFTITLFFEIHDDILLEIELKNILNRNAKTLSYFLSLIALINFSNTPNIGETFETLII